VSNGAVKRVERILGLFPDGDITSQDILIGWFSLTHIKNIPIEFSLTLESTEMADARHSEIHERYYK
jgi:hypothetical protein